MTTKRSEKRRAAELESFRRYHEAIVRLLVPAIYKEMPKPFVDPDEPAM